MVKRKVAPFPAAIDRTKAVLSLNSQTCGRFQPNQSTCPSTVRSCVSRRAPPRLTIFGSLTRALTSTVPFAARCECARGAFRARPGRANGLALSRPALAAAKRTAVLGLVFPARDWRAVVDLIRGVVLPAVGSRLSQRLWSHVGRPVRSGLDLDQVEGLALFLLIAARSFRPSRARSAHSTVPAIIGFRSSRIRSTRSSRRISASRSDGAPSCSPSR